ncbi:SixA phosphatase family protein [Marinoscillum furvescens]|uniref:Phosphohistidine phosphatase n=1 Tax=Marinoscillum furvescens DSM 4134 TaxID=1122208 RepID=A0A3D9LHD6_MARFU|nr:phosphoglycerate mutase family protein [Marinoscillum furvescens]REE05821.1 phosphohistidine phosphatase [Marinoscillum furvescens DSM 4134]
MKTLYIIRHAKSSWNFDLPDKDRPLNARGRKDVFKIAKHLSFNELTPDLIISSVASRALYTALHIADAWGYPESDIQISDELYHTSTEDILNLLSQEGTGKSIAIFGHNPGFTDLINHFNETYLDNLPTCGVVAFELDIENWKDIQQAKATEKLRAFPKRI